MDEDELNQHLNKYFSQKVQIHQEEKTRALAVWQTPVEEILQLVQDRDARFNLQRFFGGSFYERAKVKEPNEFDIMLVIEGFNIGGTVSYQGILPKPPLGFVAININESSNWLQLCQRFGNELLLRSTQTKSLFANYVSQAVRELGYSHCIDVRSSGPAVTLKIQAPSPHPSCSIDLALAVRVLYWPNQAQEWIIRKRAGWPSPTLVSEIVSEGCHLVAKRPTTYNGGDVDYLWRFSFLTAEKKLALQGSSGGEETCRKMILRILKSLKEDRQLTPLTSYHLKTIVFFECEKYPDHWQWKTSNRLAERFRSALGRLLRCLEERNCPHYFIKGFNLFDHSSFNVERYLFLIQRIQSILSNPSQHLRV